MKSIYVGIDIGGTNIKYGIFDYKKILIDKFYIKTPIKKVSQEKFLVESIIYDIKNYFKKNNIDIKNLKGIGIGVPGIVINNYVFRAVNINWKKKYDIVNILKKNFSKHLKVLIYNDANSATLGEYHKTLGGKVKSICFITLGTGVGVGVVVNGKLIEGNSGIAGEIAHVKVDFSKGAKKCNCGNVGCLETVASGSGIVNVYKKMYKCKKNITAKEIVDKAKKGDIKALKSLKISLDYLSSMIVMIMHVYDPEVFLIGGGVSNGGKIIIDIINEQIREKVFLTKTFPKVMIAKLKNDAGIYGAVNNL